MTLFQQLGNRIGEAWTHTSLGNAYVSLNQLAEGTEHHRQALAVFREIAEQPRPA